MRFRFLALNLLVSMALVLLAGCGGGNGSTPAPEAKSSIPTAPAAAATQAPTQATAPGRYTVVAAESEATYKVQEKFANRPLPVDAVGKTRAIKGEMVLTGAGVQSGTFTVDLRTLQSDSERRDRYIRDRTLETGQHPLAEFQIKESPLPGFAQGKEAKFQLTGLLKIHGVERPATWEVTGTRKGDALHWNAATQFKLTDFQITPPDIAGMLKADDLARLSVLIVARTAN